MTASSPRLAALALALILSLGISACPSCRSDRRAVEGEGAPRARAACRPLEVASAGAGTAGALEPSLFVITKLRFGRGREGVDLDCVQTPGGCDDDFCREGPEDEEGGIDNQLGSLAARISKLGGSDLQAEMSEAIRSGRHPLLLRIVGGQGPESGSATAVEISFGLDADDDPSDLASGHAKVRPDPDSPPGRPSRFEPLAVQEGVVTAGPAGDWMPLFWTRGQVAAVPVEFAHVRFRLAEAPQGSPPVGGRLVEGLLVGALRPDDLSRAILEMDGRTARVLQRLGPVVGALIRQQADLDVVAPGPTTRACRESSGCWSGQRCGGGVCIEPEERFDAVSFAISFEATSAFVP